VQRDRLDGTGLVVAVTTIAGLVTEPMSLISGSAFCTVNRVPRALSQKGR
jgi:hypothetical protein